MGRLATIGLFVASSALVYILETAKDTFDIMLQVGAGTGLLYLVRWFWWRVNAWCEVVAMISSFLASIVFLLLKRSQIFETTSHIQLVLTVLLTTVCWLAAAYLAPQTDRRTLVEFYRKVRPPGPGWRTIRADAGTSAEPSGENIPLAMLGWLSGCVVVWSSLFAVGNFLYGRTGMALLLLITFLVSGTILVRVVNRVWAGAADR
jgi:hypothetical protein